MPKILVTGATGNVGREVVRALLERGQNAVAAVRDEHAADRVPQGAESRVLRFGDPGTYPAAFRGVDKLFLMRPPQIGNVRRFLFPVIDCARDAGIAQIAFLSLIDVEHSRQTPHYKVEQHLRHSAIPYTMLRAGFFMQNLNTTHRDEIREGAIAVPVGEAKTAFVDVRDVGAVGAVVLCEAGHENRAYDLTGAVALDYCQVAELFSQVLGREVRYTNPSLLRFVRDRVRRETRLPHALIMAFLYARTRRGMAEPVTGEVERLLGRPPIAMRQYIADYAPSWQ